MRWSEGVREAGVLLKLLRGMPGQGSHASRLDRFYTGQADHYDAFRKKLLGGRRALIESLDVRAGMHIVEIGAGTGSNVGFFDDARQSDCGFTLVDLCTPLIEQAKARFRDRANVSVLRADATRLRLERPADIVLLSYALTMMPTWDEVLRRATALLAPHGQIAVVDFYLLDATPPSACLARHRAVERLFWRRWFRHDGVELDQRRLERLLQLFPDHDLTEHRHRLPWMAGLSVPYYRFVGRRGGR